MTQETAAPTDRRPGLAWSALGVVGELLITAGLLLLLLVGYQLWWTNVEADRSAAQARTELQQRWEAQVADRPEPAGGVTGLGSAFALAYIPALGDSVWGAPILQGVDQASLASGLGHYPGTALPGEVGNFALAGHRATHGEPLRDIDRLRRGDEVIIETRDEWLVYTLTHDRIVAPDDVWVVAAVPGDPDARPAQELLTLTTCNPRWASTQRWAWWGELTDRLDKDSSRTPPALGDR